MLLVALFGRDMPILNNLLVSLLGALCVWIWYISGPSDVMGVAAFAALVFLPLGFSSMNWGLAFVAVVVVLSFFDAPVARADDNRPTFSPFRMEDGTPPWIDERMAERRDDEIREHWEQIDRDNRLRRLERELDIQRAEQESERNQRVMRDRGFRRW